VNYFGFKNTPTLESAGSSRYSEKAWLVGGISYCSDSYIGGVRLISGIDYCRVGAVCCYRLDGGGEYHEKFDFDVQ
jgi:hypothetical protein